MRKFLAVPGLTCLSNLYITNSALAQVETQESTISQKDYIEVIGFIATSECLLKEKIFNREQAATLARIGLELLSRRGVKSMEIMRMSGFSALTDEYKKVNGGCEQIAKPFANK